MPRQRVIHFCPFTGRVHPQIRRTPPAPRTGPRRRTPEEDPGGGPRRGAPGPGCLGPGARGDRPWGAVDAGAGHGPARGRRVPRGGRHAVAPRRATLAGRFYGATMDARKRAFYPPKTAKFRPSQKFPSPQGFRHFFRKN